MKRILTSLLLISLFAFTVSPVYAQSSLMPDFVQCKAGNDLGDCVESIYKFGVSGVAILAVMVIMWGGFVWLTSGGNVSRVDSAKEWIYGAVLGLVLALSSYLLLNTINPQLITIHVPPPPKPVEQDEKKPSVCCIITQTATGDSSRHTVSQTLAGEDCSLLNTSKQTAEQETNPALAIEGECISVLQSCVISHSGTCIMPPHVNRSGNPNIDCQEQLRSFTPSGTWACCCR